ncbi:hypothetical protein BDF20DRAFT_836115 [Mycotypha africana]|uniref:uncharacterized protein n=1 Tax=Mycotypha africana TaxID=64632 RepID=UPI002301EC4F|nr:uncharacterized protein BDF20DRAFT_836115 [Mycotypha africana]KAI8977297.1 hypothetical protein BDF20DRAFT_836115 [Mycotypha africana]
MCSAALQIRHPVRRWDRRKVKKIIFYQQRHTVSLYLSLRLSRINHGSLPEHLLTMTLLLFFPPFIYSMNVHLFLVSAKEIRDIRRNVKEKHQNNITEDVFKDSVKQYVPTVSPTDDIFLKRLYHAFGGDEGKSIDFSKFVDGLSVFMKGTPEEKLKLSFKLYDIDKDDHISKDELEHVILELTKMQAEEEEETEEIQRYIDCMFDDFDVDCDGKLSFEEYKLSAMKEPLLADFLEKFLDKHNLSKKTTPLSRPTSIRSRQSSRSVLNVSSMNPSNHQYHHNSSSSSNSNSNNNGSNIKEQNRLSFRLSQAELLDYSHQQQQKLTSSAASTNPSPRNSIYLPTSLTPAMAASSVQSMSSNTTASSHNNTTPTNSNTTTASNVLKRDRPDLPHRLSRGASMASLDAAIQSL